MKRKSSAGKRRTQSARTRLLSKLSPSLKKKLSGSSPQSKQPQPGLRRKAKAYTVDFSVIGDSHVGYANSSAIFKDLLPKAAGSGNKRFSFSAGTIRRPGRITGRTRTHITGILKISSLPRSAASPTKLQSETGRPAPGRCSPSILEQ